MDYSDLCADPALTRPVPANCVIFHFRGHTTVMSMTWLKSASYEVVIETIKGHFGRLPENKDVLEEEAGRYEVWKQDVCLKMRLRADASHARGVVLDQTLYDFNRSGTGWKEMVGGVDRIHLVLC
ncbi:hypothetical protein PsYK624_034120 [Phanerochaete sordida]|uniref:Uncharacterized protein n=1 Tax=Phanerochaete sordida TaxID=48140 RepID=A0A9P3G3S0_9APHY|nr:hypothetical protein PsYK624_034120 [Phanerochaete sordida]